MLKIRHMIMLGGVALALPLGGVASAQQRQDVTFQITYNQTSVGQSVFVMGDTPELGGNDIRKAVKLEPTQWPIWKATISLPAGTSYTYRYYRRDDGPGRLSDVANQLAITALTTASTNPASLTPASKAVLYHSGLSQPAIFWRTGGSTGAFTRVNMVDIGAGRNSGERRWLALGVGAGEKPVDFYFTSGDGAARDPGGSATYSTRLDGVFVQDGNLFSYVPASSVSPWRSDYSTSNLPAIQSIAGNLNERRTYRVVLPRGYNQHTARRYPVVYLHDGQNVFEAGPFGTWNAHITAGTLTSAGQMRECILVGVDNGPNRISDYSAPDAGGWGDRYVRFLRDELKPVIDAQYRTLTDAANTAAIGSSMGGHISLYMGWDYTSSFQKIGAFSGAFQIYTSGFYNRVQSQPRRAIRLYLDSGDAGTANDNYWPIFNLRDNLINPARAGGVGGAYAMERDIKHVIGLGQQHNEPAWAARLPDAYRFLLPAAEDQGPLLGLASGATFDVNVDGLVNVEDLFAILETPRDVNLDGVSDLVDAGVLEWYLRRGEGADMTAGQR
jgi:predicted alpha/beta superfamily hydrolase